MAVILSKGQKIDLTKNSPNLHTILVGLGWNVNQIGGQSYDLDASVFLLDEAGKIRDEKDFIFYNNPSGGGQSVFYQGAGARLGDNEQIRIVLPSVPPYVKKIAFSLTIHDAARKGQSFSQISNPYVRVVNEQNQEELFRFKLQQFSIETAIVAAELYRHKNEWKFNAIGSGFQGGLAALCQNFGLEVEDDSQSQISQTPYEWNNSNSSRENLSGKTARKQSDSNINPNFQSHPNTTTGSRQTFRTSNPVNRSQRNTSNQQLFDNQRNNQGHFPDSDMNQQESHTFGNTWNNQWNPPVENQPRNQNGHFAGGGAYTQGNPIPGSQSDNWPFGNPSANASFRPAPQGDVQCPRCHSDYISSGKKGFGIGKAAIGGLVLGPVGILGGFIGANKIELRCNSCQYKWSLDQTDFAGMFSKQKENAKRLLQKYTNNNVVLDALMASCALVALADGHLDQSEQQKVYDFIHQSDELRAFNINEVINRFNHFVRGLQMDPIVGRGEALRAVGKVRDQDDLARLVVRYGIAVGFADGVFVKQEQETIYDICNELRLNPGEFLS